MRNFDTYNPEIEEPSPWVNPQLTYGEDSLSEENIADVTPKKNTVRKVVQKKSNNVKKSKSQLNKQKTNYDLGGNIRYIYSGIARIFNSPGMKLFLGSLFGLFGIWLLVGFISFVTSGFQDSSAIAHTPVGHAEVVKNSAGELGARISSFLIKDCFGLGAIVVVFWLLATCLKMFKIVCYRSVNFFIKCLVALLTVSLIVGLMTIASDCEINWGGNHGRFINQELLKLTGWYGAFIVCLLLIVSFIAICLNDLRLWILRLRKRIVENKRVLAEEQAAIEARKKQIDELQGIEDNEIAQADDKDLLIDNEHYEVSFDESDEELTYSESEDDFELPQNDINSVSEGNKQELINSDDNDENKTSEEIVDYNGDIMKVNVNNIEDVVRDKRPDIYDPTAELSHYKFPSYELLRDSKTRITVDQEEQMQNKERIRKTLLNFDIPIVGIEATVGPTVTLYEIIPDKGVRIAKIRNLVDDIALSLAAIGVRIIAPIPGKGTVGIEVANKDPQTVSMRTVIHSRKYQETKYELPIALGSTISGDVYIADLAKMPHLLVAGATGQGKSVGLNAIIASLLYRKHPTELKLVLIDPKMVEFSLYADISNHYLARLPEEEEAIITDPQKVVATLSSLCVEMDNRYGLLKDANVRNIKEYNSKFISKRLNPEKGHRFLPYIVVIVDEFSDLIMTAGKEVEMPIARIAQKARAVGIHMIIATQRPSTNVITGVIKANFPARMAFKVSSGVDSKTILDTTGAQQLIGRGDMLLSTNSEMERVQCAFIDTPEVEAICKHISEQPSFGHPYILPEPLLANDSNSGFSGETGTYGARDPLFEEVARLIVNSNTASTSSLQRRYSIGYNRAGKIMDQLEAAGIVGPAQGGKARPVLVDPIALENMI